MAHFKFVHHLHEGQRYLASWPQRPELNALLPENRVIRATLWAQKLTPACAVVALLVQYQWGQALFWPQTVACILFSLSLPLQGYYWLGHRAQQLLPLQLASWYQEINARMQQEARDALLPPVRRQPRYVDLALTLTAAFRQLDKSFLYDH
ncbi:MAG: terminus macrodomain insulation protein YfbV [Aeromonas sp.]